MGNPERGGFNPEAEKESFVEKVKEKLEKLKSAVETAASPEGRQKARVEKAVDRALEVIAFGSRREEQSESISKIFEQEKSEAMKEIEKLREIERSKGASEDSAFIKEALETLNISDR